MSKNKVMRTSIIVAVLFGAFNFAFLNQSFAGWTNAGEKELILTPASTSLKVQAGTVVRITIDSHVENDTETVGTADPEQHDDGNKKWRILNGSTVIGQDTGVNSFDLNIAASTTVGTTFTIKVENGDTRFLPDVRHDPYQVVKTYTIEVIDSSLCPTSLSSSMDNLTAPRPVANETYGKWEATMTANGTPPVGWSNWNGLALTEKIDNNVFEANKFITGIGLIGRPGTTFVIGSSDDNEFIDTHAMLFEPTWDILKPGISQGTVTSDQEYTCSPSKKYNFTITRTCIRVGTDRIKVDISK